MSIRSRLPGRTNEGHRQRRRRPIPFNPILLAFLFTAFSTTALAAQSLQRLADIERGQIGEFDVVRLRQDPPRLDFVAALQNGANRLQVDIWRTDSSGDLERIGQFVTDGTIQDVALTRLDQSLFVTSVRDSVEKLRVILWRWNGQTIERLSTFVGLEISHVSAGREDATFVDDGRGGFFVAARTRGGNLAVYVFKLNARKDGLVRTDFQQYGEAELVTGINGQTIAVALRDGNSRLRVIHFFIRDNGTIARRPFDTGGGVVDIGFTEGFFPNNLYTITTDAGPTGVRTASLCRHRLLIGHGIAKVIEWQRDPGGPGFANATVSRRRELTFSFPGESAHLGIARNVDLMSLNNRFLVSGQLGFGTWCRLRERDRGNPHLHLTLIKTTPEDDGLRRLNRASLEGDFSDVKMGWLGFSDSREEDQSFVVLLRERISGNLRITIWKARNLRG